VNVDIETTTVMNKEFAWWFGSTPKITDEHQLRDTKNQIIPPLLLIRSYKNANGKDQVEIIKAKVISSTGKEELLMVHRKKKEYILEKFTYSWRSASPFSQHFKCNLHIEGKDYSCAEQ